ncbi:MAG TPA: DUF1648 domain-containing protein, partial [Chloroflexota bacterium]|nr:DUF1648 domain-containing protein [Chloroflexota bacterium]
LVAGAALLDLAIWLYIGLRQRMLPEVLPIHYNSAGQVDRIGVRAQLFILPVIGLLALALNAVLGYFIGRRAQQLAYLLLSVSLLVQVLIIGAAVQLVH